MSTNTKVCLVVLQNGCVLDRFFKGLSNPRFAIRLLASVPMSSHVIDFIKEIVSMGTWVTWFLLIKVNSSIVMYNKFNWNFMGLTEIMKVAEITELVRRKYIKLWKQVKWI